MSDRSKAHETWNMLMDEIAQTATDKYEPNIALLIADWALTAKR
jgi:hypothetical protein